MNTAGITFAIFFQEARKWIFSIIVILVALYLIQNRGTFSWIDNADLVIHEAGHFFFIMFGRFLYTLGGTLMQIIIPALIYTYFHRNGYRTGSQVALLWLGQNFINISVYAADARARVLPLLGGKKVYHDWNYLLGELGILQFDIQVGYFFLSLAVITFLISVFMPLIIRD